MNRAEESGKAPQIRLGLLMHRSPCHERPFGPQTPFGEQLSRLAELEAVSVVVLSPDEIDLNRTQIKGWRYGGPMVGWVEEGGPLPDVLWARCCRWDHRALFDRLRHMGVPFLNEGCLDKWEAHQVLAADQALAPHLPETRLLDRVSVVHEMLDRHPVLYFKPLYGAVGRGIIQAEREARGLARLQYLSTETGQIRERYASDQQLERWLHARGRAGRFVAQQGLDLNVLYGRKADIRVLVQKDSAGRWRVTGMGGRVAARDRFTANLHTGGQSVPVSMLAEALFPRDNHRRKELLIELEELALTTAARVEGAAGAMGELGIDLGVEPGGKIWVIEQNAQPGRKVFQELGHLEQYQLAHWRPIQYARYLVDRNSARVARTGAT